MPDLDSTRIVPYQGFGDGRTFRLRGRVLLEAHRSGGAAAAGPLDSAWRNARNMYRRFGSGEVRGALVRGELAGEEFFTTTDEQGGFQLELAPRTPPPARDLWHPVTLTVTRPGAVTDPSPPAVGYVLSPPSSARFVVVSDLDDTVVRTNVTSPLSMARTVLLKNARTRVPFPGVAPFYQALQDGAGEREGNPIFYVSSSPWNLFDHLIEFLSHHGVPHGPLLLRAWGLRRSARRGSRQHKLAAIELLLGRYPDLPFVLVGDSGQKDPEIYAELVRRHPRRIRAIYIRSVHPDPRRLQAIHALAEEVLAAGSTLVLAEDTMAAARHAAEQGWIDPARLDAVAGTVAQESSARAAPAETVVIAPSGRAAAAAVMASGAVEAAASAGNDGAHAPAVVVEGQGATPTTPEPVRSARPRRPVAR
jgi:phosphatidate phosphatase APP1